MYPQSMENKENLQVGWKKKLRLIEHLTSCKDFRNDRKPLFPCK